MKSRILTIVAVGPFVALAVPTAGATAIATSTSGATGTASAVPQYVIVETDMDISDAMALLYLLARVDVKVIAIVVDGDGEARCPRGATNALSLAALAGKPDIPVGCGTAAAAEGSTASRKRGVTSPTTFGGSRDRRGRRARRQRPGSRCSERRSSRPRAVWTY